MTRVQGYYYFFEVQIWMSNLNGVVHKLRLQDEVGRWSKNVYVYTYQRKCQRRWSKNLQSFQRSLNYQSQYSSRPSWHCSLSVNQNYLFKKVVKMQVLVIGAKVISLPRSALLNCQNTEPLNTADRIQVQLEGSEQPSRKPLSPPTLFGCQVPAKAKHWSDYMNNHPEIQNSTGLDWTGQEFKICRTGPARSD